MQSRRTEYSRRPATCISSCAHSGKTAHSSPRSERYRRFRRNGCNRYFSTDTRSWRVSSRRRSTAWPNCRAVLWRSWLVQVALLAGARMGGRGDVFDGCLACRPRTNGRWSNAGGRSATATAMAVADRSIEFLVVAGTDAAPSSRLAAQAPTGAGGGGLSGPEAGSRTRTLLPPWP